MDDRRVVVFPVELEGQRFLSDIRVARVGHIPSQQAFRRGLVFSKHALMYIVKGRGTYRSVPGEPIAVTPGTIFSAWPGGAFDYGPADGETWEEYFIAFSGRRVRLWLEAKLLPRKPPLLTVGVAAEGVERFEDLLQLGSTDRPDILDRAAILLEQLLVTLGYAHRLGRPGPREDLSSRIVKRLRQRFRENVNFRQLAGEHNVSYSTFRRLVERSTGASPQQFLNTLRIRKARELLSRSDSPIKEIGFEVGIPNANYFSRLFGRLEGLSPRAFRRQMGINPSGATSSSGSTRTRSRRS